MKYIAENVPLWSVTTWDKSYNGVDKEWQPKTIKYKYLLSDELDQINIGGDVCLLYTGKNTGYTTERLAGDALCEGEIVSIPWGGTPSVKYFCGKFVTGDNRIATSNKPDTLLNKYLYYFMKGNLKEIASYYRGAGLKHPSMKDVLKMRISYPDVITQKRIISRFEHIETIIDLLDRQIKSLDELIKARFVEMFGDPKVNNKGFVKAPMGNYMTLLTDFSSNGSYKTLDSGVTMYDEPNYAWMVRTTDLESGDMSSIKYIDERAYALLSKSKIFGGEIIMNKIGSAGKVYLMPEINMPASLGRNAFMFRYDNRINVRFLYEQLVSEYGQSEIQQYIRGAVTKTINKEDARAVKIIVPDKSLQDEFVDFVKQVDKSKVVVQQALEKTQLLFDKLMQEYFG